MRKTISKLLCMVTVLAVVLTMMPAAMVSAVYTERLPRVTVHLLGDSTVTSYAKSETTGITGWGQGLEALLNDYVTVNNWAISGLSTRGMLESLGLNSEAAYAEQWTTILKNVDAGDYVFIQFGHNDQKTNSTDEIEKALSADVDAYTANLEKLIADTKAKGATPILVTPPERKNYATYDDAAAAFTYAETLGGYPAAMRAVAANKGVALIDLNTETKTLLAGKKADELTAFYAKNSDGETSDPAHFSPDGALTLAKYIAGQLETAAPALADYIKTDYASVETSAISYGKTYLRMNFQKATTKEIKLTNSNTEYTVSDISGEHYSKAITDRYDTHTGAYTDSDTNTAMFLKSDKARNNYSLFDANSGAMTQSLMCYDFSIKLPAGEKKSASFLIRNESYKSEAWVTVYSSADGKINIKIPCGDRDLTFANVEKLNYGEWNNFRVILDQTARKFHLIANGKLVCTDIPYNTGSDGDKEKKTRYIYFGTASEITGNEVYFDDVYIKSITEKQAVKMLLSAADEYLKDTVLVADATRTDGVVEGSRLYLPANAALTTTAKTFTWNEPVQTRNVTNNKDFFNDTPETTDFSASTEPFYKSYFIYSPQGYTVANKDDAYVYFKPAITVGSTTVNTGDLLTASFMVKRRLMLDYDDTLEISVPKLMDKTNNVSPNGTNAGWASLYGAVTNTTEYTAMRINNNGTKERELLAGLCYFEGEKLHNVSKMRKLTIAAGAAADYSVGSAMAALPTVNPSAKFFVIDAKTLMPLMDAIIVE